MRICTITCHDVYNYGASLQAYALMRYLEGLGHQVEIIDYKPDYLSGHYQLWAADSPMVRNSKLLAVLYVLLKLPGRVLTRRRKLAFDRFRAKYMKLTPFRYRSYLDLQSNPPQADCYFAGSDQIWNTSRPNGRDPAFYLMFVRDEAIKASYAASLATDAISEDAREQVKVGVSSLNHVSVRESNAVTMLRDLGVENVTHVLDPVFLLPKQHWSTIGVDRYDDPYVLVYDFEVSAVVRQVAMDYAAFHQSSIYSVGSGKCDYADRNFSHAGPAEFVSLIRNAQFVVTNSYHAIIFCLIYGVDLYVTGRSEAINSRMEDLLAQFGFSTHSFIPLRSMEDEVLQVITEKLRASEAYISECLRLPV